MMMHYNNMQYLFKFLLKLKQEKNPIENFLSNGKKFLYGKYQ